MEHIINKRTGILLTVAGVIALMIQMSTPHSPNSTESTAPVIPVGTSVLNPEASISYLEGMVRKHPENTGYQLSLVQTYLQYAVQMRQEPVYIPKAEKLLQSLTNKNPNLYEARALQATLFNTLHEFEKARDIAVSLLEENGKAAYVYGILIDALVELGQYEEAVACV